MAGERTGMEGETLVEYRGERQATGGEEEYRGEE